MIDGYQHSVKEEFTEAEKAEAFVLAQRAELKERDPRAGARLEQYLNGTVDDERMRVFYTSSRFALEREPG